jgi:YD repeat-containing protein
VAEKDQDEKTTEFQHDELGRLTRIVQTLDGQPLETTYAYDELGNRISQTDAEGRMTWFQYDEQGRETARVLPAVGGVSAMETKTYHDDGSLKTHTDFMGRTTTYTYSDCCARLESKTYENGESVAYTYTPAGRRETVTSTVHGLPNTVSYAYDARDQVVEFVSQKSYQN